MAFSVAGFIVELKVRNRLSDFSDAASRRCGQNVTDRTRPVADVGSEVHNHQPAKRVGGDKLIKLAIGFGVLSCFAVLAPVQAGEPVGNDDYPPEALSKHEQGIVLVDLTIGIDGRANDCKVLSQVQTRCHSRTRPAKLF